MKNLTYLVLSIMLISCAGNDRDVATQEQEEQTFEHMERAGDFGRENRN